MGGLPLPSSALPFSAGDAHGHVPSDAVIGNTKT